MAISLGFLIEIFFHIIIFLGFYYNRDSHTNPYIFVGHAHTELGMPVDLSARRRRRAILACILTADEQ